MSKKSWNNGTRQLEVLAEGIYKGTRGSGIWAALDQADYEARMEKEAAAKEDAVSKQETGPIDPEDPTKVVGGTEDAENETHARLDGMVHQELFSQLQQALTAVVADLHADGEEFEVSDVCDYLCSKMGK